MSYSIVDVNSVIREFLLAGTAPSAGTLAADLAIDGASINLVSSPSGLPGGLTPVKIDDEIILVAGTGDPLIVEGNGRGAFGTTAAIHLSGAMVSRALLPQAIGAKAYFSKAPEGSGPGGYTNTVPAVVYNVIGTHKEGVNEIRYPRVKFRCFGGRDSSGNVSPLLPSIIQRLLIEKANDLEAPLTLSSGTVISAVPDGEGESLWDDTVEPAWPYSILFLNMEIRKG